MTLPSRQRQVVLAHVSDGVPAETDFQIVEAGVPEPAEGEFLARSVYLSLDPYLRSVIAGRHVGHEPMSSGDLMPGRSVARVAASRNPRFAPGDFVLLETGWQEYALSDGRGVRRLDPVAGPLSASLGLLGMPGLTAWAGVSVLMCPRPQSTLLVSSAAGAVGSAAGQIARLAGCRVVGIAGGEEKCGLATRVFGFDACIDYRVEGWRDRLAAACPGGVDGYFDNAGGEVLAAAFDLLGVGGSVVLCGLASQYNGGPPSLIPAASIIRKRARVQGLVVYDHEARFPEFLSLASGWLRDGRISFVEERFEGLSRAPAAFCRLMSGRNVGKSIVVVGPEVAPGEGPGPGSPA